MNYTIIRLGLLIACAVTNAAHANPGITASIGTTGAGLHLSLPVAAQTNLRVGVNGLSRSTSGNTDNVDYDYKLKLSTIDALVDYFPRNGTFRVSGGISYNGNEIDVNGRPRGGTFTLNGRVYPAAAVGALYGDVTFRKMATYLGIGWGNAAAMDKGWGFSSDIGVILQGSPRTTLSTRSCDVSAAICEEIANDVAAENRELQEDVKDYKVYPVVRVGLSYKF